MFLGGLWALTSSFELAHGSLAGKVLWERLHFIPTALVAVALFATVLRTQGRTRWLAPWPFVLFLIVPALIISAALSGWGGGLFMSRFGVVSNGRVSVLTYLAGPLYLVHVAYAYVLLTGSLFLLLSMERGSQSAFQQRSRHVTAAIFLPVLVNVLFHIGVTPVTGVDYTPAAMTITGVLVALPIFRFSLPSIIPIASRLIVRTMRELMLVVDASDNLVDFNPSAREIIGIDAKRAVGRPLRDLPEPWGEALVPFAGVASTRETVRVQLDRGTRWYHVSVSTPLDESGNPVGRLFVLHDITERKLIEESLRESEEKFRGFIEESVEAIMLIDEDGRVIEFNPGAERMSGLRRSDVLGLTIWRLVTMTAPKRRQNPGFEQRLEARFRGVLRSGAANMLSRPLETSLVRADGVERRFRQYMFSIRTPRGFRIGSISHDITEAREAEEALARSREQLQQALKMEAIGRLAGGIAHDFNNLLTVIRGYCEIIGDDLADDSVLKDQVNEISKATRRAAELTAQLLTFGRKQLLQPQVFAINELVANMEKMLGRVIREDIRLVTSLHPEVGHVRADPGRLEQVIMNLAVNARDAMPSGGTLAIETRSCTLDEASVADHPEMYPGTYVKLTISDTGTGMDAATRERIFEPFFTTKPVGKGSGLGLPTAYGIVKQSDGHIFCYSEPGKGTTFSIYLPSVSDPLTAQASPAPRSTAPEGSETILLVEDDETVRTFTTSLLRSNGYTVVEAASGAEALTRIDSEGKTIDLLLTDVVMPGMSGQDLAREIRSLCPDISVLYVSGYAETIYSDSDSPGLHHGFLQKPFSSVDLLGRIRHMLDSRSDLPGG